MPRGAAMESVCPESQLPTTLANRVQLVVQHFPDAFANHKQAPRSQQRSHRGLHSNYRISEKPLTEMTLLCVGVFAAYLLVVIFITPQHATPTHPSLCLHYRPNGRLWTICFFALSLSLTLEWFVQVFKGFLMHDGMNAHRPSHRTSIIYTQAHSHSQGGIAQHCGIHNAGWLVRDGIVMKFWINLDFSSRAIWPQPNSTDRLEKGVAAERGGVNDGSNIISFTFPHDHISRRIKSRLTYRCFVILRFRNA